MSARPWYRRYASDFIAGTLGMPLEEKGAYSLIIDLIFDRGGPIPDDARYISGVCGCSVRKWNAIRNRLLLLGKITVENGTISNHRADFELEIAAKISDERAENGSKGGNKSAQIRADVKKTNDLAPANVKRVPASHFHIHKEERSSISKNDAAPSGFQVDRIHDEELFKACEAIAGEVPAYMQRKTFGADVVDQARKQLTAALN